MKVDLETNADILLAAYPEFIPHKTGTLNRAGQYVSYVIPNPNVPRYPLEVTIYEMDGIFVDFGPKISIIECQPSVDNIVLDVINKVLKGQVIVGAIFKNQKNYDEFNSSMVAIFYDESDTELGSMEEYVAWIEKVSKVLNPIKRLFTLYKGIIEITNWSGSEYRKIHR